MKKIKLKKKIQKKSIKLTWDNLRLSWLNCRRCSLSETRNKVVLGEGPGKAEVLLIGEAPGATEDEIGKPFVGKVGAIMNRILEVCKVDRRKIYITNVLACRPPSNRAPQLKEKKMCFSRLKMEIELVNPRYIIFCGNHAAHLSSICEEYDKFFSRFRTFGMFHPGSIRHAGAERRDVIEQQVKFWAKEIKRKGVKL